MYLWNRRNTAAVSGKLERPAPATEKYATAALFVQVAAKLRQYCVVRFLNPSKEMPRASSIGWSGFAWSPNGSAAKADSLSGESIRSAIGEPWCGVEIVVSERIGASIGSGSPATISNGCRVRPCYER